MVQEAERYKGQDDMQREKITAKNSLESYAFNMKSSVEEEKMKGKISEEDKNKVIEKCNQAISWLELQLFLQQQIGEESIRDERKQLPQHPLLQFPQQRLRQRLKRQQLPQHPLLQFPQQRLRQRLKRQQELGWRQQKLHSLPQLHKDKPVVLQELGRRQQKLHSLPQLHKDKPLVLQELGRRQQKLHSLPQLHKDKPVVLQELGRRQQKLHSLPQLHKDKPVVLQVSNLTQ
ncbi:uncharacterized protein [Chiloscyllium punctatum]|uniref:uncharacterized protein n=1 Tax=Chiloscyllium punctatum TaxID=137246 RepID=UPI003B63403D